MVQRITLGLKLVNHKKHRLIGAYRPGVGVMEKSDLASGTVQLTFTEIPLANQTCITNTWHEIINPDLVLHINSIYFFTIHGLLREKHQQLG